MVKVARGRPAFRSFLLKLRILEHENGLLNYLGVFRLPDQIEKLPAPRNHGLGKEQQAMPVSLHEAQEIRSFGRQCRIHGSPWTKSECVEHGTSCCGATLLPRISE